MEEARSDLEVDCFCLANHSLQVVPPETPSPGDIDECLRHGTDRFGRDMVFAAFS